MEKFEPLNNDQLLPRIRVKNVDTNFEREPLFPFHFKGSVITEIWQIAAYLLKGNQASVKLD